MPFAEGTLIVDQHGTVRLCSGAVAKLLGRRAAELAGRPVWSFLPGWTPFGAAQPQSAALRLAAGGAGIPVEVSCETLYLPGQTLFVLELRRPGDGASSEEELETFGLAHRSLFLDRLEQSLRRAPRREEPFALALVDIDRFAALNEQLGRANADAVLRAVAARLGQSLRASDTVSRIGGDEFGLILYGAATHKAAARVLAKVLAAAAQLAHAQIVATLSAGACLFPGDGGTADELRLRAGSALARAKRAGGGTFRFYRNLATRSRGE